MLRKKLSKDKSVSDKITELFSRQVNGDGHSSDVATEEPRVEQEFDEYDLPDVGSSDIRKRNVKLLSEQSVRYRGKISSRKELEEESEQEDTAEDDEEEESTDEAIKAYTTKLNNNKAKSNATLNESDDSENEDANDDSEPGDVECDDYEDDIDDEDDEDDEDEDYQTDADVDSEADDADNDIVAQSNRQSEVQKGKSVQNQLYIWERLLEMRIHTQKILSKANKLPAPNVLKAQATNNDELTKINRTSIHSITTLLNSLLELKKCVCQQNTEYRNALKNTLKRPLPLFEPEKLIEPPIKRIADHLDAQFQEQKIYRNSVLLKWDDRTKLLTPGAGAKKKSLAEDYDVIRKIDSALQQRSALIDKSQLLKDDPNVNAAKAEENSIDDENRAKRNKDIYDDSDFYHQQLRELIEYKTNSSASATELTQQYVELQKLRQKMKKKVDTRASKGRKLRYTVHNKLINFMAPDDKSTWTDESKDELYRSLFAV